ncbi:tRNA pseudouridine(13) synthase TruD [Actinobacillus delphinicola]|uniref:tRNA pseudouridine synthase D n=1 Tax=Actinobacillus delphinicola TaxID=51161 RepID=A0A448TSD6_9PAST|nr:tRNA pseudouridine(13) synthase TruD [Actinobacillus delphinicola]VEJ08954.1 tRNA pseudouridine synthase D [Actinobacillus delphinicola]
MELTYLNDVPEQTGRLKAENKDFIVRERLGYEMSGDGEFVALYVRKNGANTLFVGEKLAKFAEVSVKNMGYAGLKDRHAVTEQWFCLQMPGKPTPDFSQFELDGVEILTVTRHNRKIRVGSLEGNEFELLLRDVKETEELVSRLNAIKTHGFPNYFGEQRFGQDDNNLAQALRWAQGEIKVKDRKKQGFYLSAARSYIFNLIVAKRIEKGLAQTVCLGDVLQLAGTHSWFVADETQDLAQLQQRVNEGDLLITAPLIGESDNKGSEFEQEIIAENADFLALMQKERMKAARRAILMKPEDFTWQFETEGLRLKFYLPAGSYATALVRELIHAQEER